MTSLNTNASAYWYRAAPAGDCTVLVWAQLGWTGAAVQDIVGLIEDVNTAAYTLAGTGAGNVGAYLVSGGGFDGGAAHTGYDPDWHLFALDRSGDTMRLRVISSGADTVTTVSTRSGFSGAALTAYVGGDLYGQQGGDLAVRLAQIHSSSLSDAALRAASRDPSAAGAWSSLALTAVADSGADISGNARDWTLVGTPIEDADEPPETVTSLSESLEVDAHSRAAAFGSVGVGLARQGDTDAASFLSQFSDISPEHSSSLPLESSSFAASFASVGATAATSNLVDAPSYSSAFAAVAFDHGFAVPVLPETFSSAFADVSTLASLEVATAAYEFTNSFADVALTHSYTVDTDGEAFSSAFADVGIQSSGETLDVGAAAFSATFSAVYPWLRTTLAAEAASYSTSYPGVGLSHGWTIEIESSSSSSTFADIEAVGALAVESLSGSYEATFAAVSIDSITGTELGVDAFSCALSAADVAAETSWLTPIEPHSHPSSYGAIGIVYGRSIETDAAAFAAEFTGSSPQLSTSVAVSSHARAVAFPALELSSARFLDVDAYSHSVAFEDVGIEESSYDQIVVEAAAFGSAFELLGLRGDTEIPVQAWSVTAEFADAGAVAQLLLPSSAYSFISTFAAVSVAIAGSELVEVDQFSLASSFGDTLPTGTFSISLNPILHTTEFGSIEVNFEPNSPLSLPGPFSGTVGFGGFSGVVRF